MNLSRFAPRHYARQWFGAFSAVILASVTADLYAAEHGLDARKSAAATRAERSDVEAASFERPLGADAAVDDARGGKPARAKNAKGVPLPRRGETKAGAASSGRVPRPAGTASTLATGAASLAVVLGLFFVVAWALRRGMPRGNMLLPGDVVEVLGRAPLSGRQFAHLVRCGNKLLLVHLAPGCAETLTEITDPVEVDRLSGLCKQAQPQSSTSSFRQVFQQFSREKPDDAARRAYSGKLLASLRDHQQPVSAAEDTDV